jgi:hypothetical protein
MATVKKIIKTRFYVLTKEVGANDKCPPQAKLILDTIKAAGGKMTREDLIKDLKRPVEEGGLKTNQTAERILGFYKPRLTEMGVLKEETETSEIEVEVEDKPAKAPKEKAAAGTDGATADSTAEAGTAPGTASKGAKGEPKRAAA